MLEPEDGLEAYLEQSERAQNFLDEIGETEESVNEPGFERGFDKGQEHAYKNCTILVQQQGDIVKKRINILECAIFGMSFFTMINPVFFVLDYPYIGILTAFLISMTGAIVLLLKLKKKKENEEDA